MGKLKLAELIVSAVSLLLIIARSVVKLIDHIGKLRSRKSAIAAV